MFETINLSFPIINFVAKYFCLMLCQNTERSCVYRDVFCHLTVISSHLP